MLLSINRLTTLYFVLLLSIFQSSHAGVLDQAIGNDAVEFLPVEEAFPVTYSQSPGQLAVSFTTPDGYYLYKSRLYIKQGSNTVFPVHYSQEGKEKEDEAFGQITAFYHNLDVRFDLGSLKDGNYILTYQGCAEAGLCYPPQRLSLEHTPQPTQSKAAESEAPVAKPTSTTDSWFSNRSWGAVAGLFFLLGLGLTFTPCVLPMLPILTSVVLGQNNNSPAKGFALSSIYVLGMALTYAAAGLTVGLLGAGANVQVWMQTPWVLILFSALFVALALAMFGLYELQLPAGLRNRLNQLNQQQQGGQWLSVFVMGILSALVVSPCVSAPLAGALVYLSTTGDAWLGGSALLALGLGMGAPLIVLGTTGASILPKAGGWMEQIKAFFGVLLLGVAIWLLSRILPGQIVLLLWSLLALVYGIVLGALEPATSAASRLVKGVAWVFLLYGAAAFIGVLQGQSDPLNPLANNQSHIAAPYSVSSNTHSTPFKRTASVEDVKNTIATSSRAVMVDLYADWCISCKVMDEEIFAQPDVQQQLKHLTWIQLDVTEQTPENIAFMKAHSVFGPPSILFFQQGSEVTGARIIGETTRADFIQGVLKHFPG